jgi:hypothetical protein
LLAVDRRIFATNRRYFVDAAYLAILSNRLPFSTPIHPGHEDLNKQIADHDGKRKEKGREHFMHRTRRKSNGGAATKELRGLEEASQKVSRWREPRCLSSLGMTRQRANQPANKKQTATLAERRKNEHLPQKRKSKVVGGPTWIRTLPLRKTLRLTKSREVLGKIEKCFDFSLLFSVP